MVDSTLSIKEYNYIFDYNTAKEKWEILKMIYKYATKIKRDRMNILEQEYENPWDFEGNLQNHIFNNIRLLVTYKKSIS